VKVSLTIPEALDGQLSRYRVPGSRLQRHSHDVLELDHVIRGSATLLIGSERVTLEARSLLWLFPGQEHLVIENSDDFEMWIACFRRRLVKQCCVGEETRPLRSKHENGVHCRVLDPLAARHLCELLAEVSAYEEPDNYNAGLAHILVHAWLQYRQAEGG
jgi:hypothetical protein